MWVLTVLDSPVALGSVSAAYAIGMIVGSVVFATLAPYLPRYSALVFGYFVGGAPRFLVFALTDDLTVIVIVTFISGMAMCSVNPTVGAVIYQRVPGPMLARAGRHHHGRGDGRHPARRRAGRPGRGAAGLVNGVLLASLLYFAVTLTPVIRHRVWRELNDAGARGPTADPAVALPRGYGLAATALGPRVTLRYADGRVVAAGQGGAAPAGPAAGAARQDGGPRAGATRRARRARGGARTGAARARRGRARGGPAARGTRPGWNSR